MRVCGLTLGSPTSSQSRTMSENMVAFWAMYSGLKLFMTAFRTGALEWDTITSWFTNWNRWSTVSEHEPRSYTFTLCGRVYFKWVCSARKIHLVMETIPHYVLLDLCQYVVQRGLGTELHGMETQIVGVAPSPRWPCKRCTGESTPRLARTGACTGTSPVPGDLECSGRGQSSARDKEER